MRMLLVTNDYPPRAGGIQRYLSSLVKCFPGETRVLAPAAPAVPPLPGVVRGDRTFLWPTSSVRDWVTRQVEEFRPEVLVFGAPWPLASLGPALARRTGIPFAVITYGADLTVPAALPVLRQVVAGTLRRAAAVFSLSRYTTARTERLTGRVVHYLGCGIDLEAFHPGVAGREWPVVGCVSRFVERKGQARVLRAAHDLWRSGRRLEVLLVGEGPGERRLRRLAEQVEVPVRFEVGASWDRLPELYREMDIFCMPVHSRWLGLEVEGLGIVYLEAAATGLPVLAGGSGGAPETVEPGVTGFVVRSDAHLRQGLELLLGQPERARLMGEAGRRRVGESFSWKAVVERFQAGLAGAVRAGRE
ncbi:MAG: glycosyltransferase family 4 protein [Acidimicrobiia bacterium]